MFFSFLALSYNRPYLCPNATWNPNATTFASSDLVGNDPGKTFVDASNTVYVANRQMGGVIVWWEGAPAPTRSISGFNALASLFVVESGDIYIAYFPNFPDRVDKFTTDSQNKIPVLYAFGRCFDIFIDINNNFYCSMDQSHQVLMKPLSLNANAMAVVAGTGTGGSTSNMLHYPNGIFVDSNLDLYVADAWNDRIQLFPTGQLNAKTVAGSGSSNDAIHIESPIAVTLDGNGYIYITVYGYHRIIRSGVNGLECIVGCSGTNGPESDQLTLPTSLSFDSYGNLFVTDSGNHRIQKFDLLTDSCGKQERNQWAKLRLCREIACQIK